MLMHFYSWEYPNKQGIGCNIISPDDSANFLSFLQELRKDPVGSNLTISAAVGLTPFMGLTAPMTDVSPFAEVLDHIGEPLLTRSPLHDADIDGVSTQPSWRTIFGAHGRTRSAPTLHWTILAPPLKPAQRLQQSRHGRRLASLPTRSL